MNRRRNSSKSTLWEIVCFVIVSGLLSSVAIAENNNQSLPMSLKQSLLLGQYQQSIKQLQQLADSGNLEAKYQLALCYLDGKGVVVSSQKAKALLEQVSQTMPKAAFLLGNLLIKGDKLQANSKRGNQYVALAAKMNYQPAINQLNQSNRQNNNNRFPPAQTQRLFELAILTGNLAEATQRYNKGASVNFPNQQGATPLITAIKNKRTDVALWLISQGANVNKEDSSNDTPLITTIKTNQLQIMSRLLNKKADPNQFNRQGECPLLIAIEKGNQEMVSRLLAKGAKVRNDSAKGINIKTLAKEKGIVLGEAKQRISDSEASKVQLKYQRNQIAKLTRDPKSRFYNWPPLMVAVAQGQKELVPALEKQEKLAAMVTPSGVDLIELASSNGFPKLAENAFIASINKHKKDNQWYLKQLAVAIEKKNDVLFDRILDEAPHLFQEKGALNSNIRQLMIKSDNSQYLFRLLKIETVRNFFNTDNMWFEACQNATGKVMTGIAGTFLQLDRQDKHGRTCAWYQARQAKPRVLGQLINLGANIDLPDNNGATPLVEATLAKCEACVQTILKQSKSPEKASKDGNNPLILAANNKPKIVKLLLNSGRFAVENRNGQSMTALMIAVQSNCYECAQYLLDAGANPNRKSKNDENSFDMAEGNKKLLSLLEQY